MAQHAESPSAVAGSWQGGLGSSQRPGQGLCGSLCGGTRTGQGLFTRRGRGYSKHSGLRSHRGQDSERPHPAPTGAGSPLQCSIRVMCPCHMDGDVPGDTRESWPTRPGGAVWFSLLGAALPCTGGAWTGVCYHKSLARESDRHQHTRRGLPEAGSCSPAPSGPRSSAFPTRRGCGREKLSLESQSLPVSPAPQAAW